MGCCFSSVEEEESEDVGGPLSSEVIAKRTFYDPVKNNILFFFCLFRLLFSIKRFR